MDYKLILLVLAILTAIVVYFQGKSDELDSEDKHGQAVQEREAIKKAAESSGEKLDQMNFNQDKIIENTEISRMEAEAQKFFRENNFTFLSDFYNYGYIVIRQTEDGKRFSMASDTKNVTFDDYNYSLELNGTEGILYIEGGEFGLGNNTFSNSFHRASGLKVDKEHIYKLQETGLWRIKDSCGYFMLLQLNYGAYTYAVGRAKCTE